MFFIEVSICLKIWIAGVFVGKIPVCEDDRQNVSLLDGNRTCQFADLYFIFCGFNILIPLKYFFTGSKYFFTKLYHLYFWNTLPVINPNYLNMLQTLKAVKMMMESDWYSLTSEVVIWTLLDWLSHSQSRKVLSGHLPMQPGTPGEGQVKEQ